MPQSGVFIETFCQIEGDLVGKIRATITHPRTLGALVTLGSAMQ